MSGLVRSLTASGLVGRGGLKSKIKIGQRTGATGSGTETVTGVGFAPLAMLIWANFDSATDDASWGFGDSGNSSESLYAGQATTTFNDSPDFLIVLDAGTVHYWTASLTSLDSDGCTMEFVENGTAADMSYFILFLG